jgi:hypothetical protein
MSPDMQCFKDVVCTKDKLLYGKGTHVLLPWRGHVAGHAMLQGCGTYQRKLLKRKFTHVLLPWRSYVAGHAVLQGCGTYQG